MARQKVALVTGSGKKRVGWYVADALAGRGYALAVHYRTSAADAAETVAALQARGVEAAAFQADLTDGHQLSHRALGGFIGHEAPAGYAKGLARPSAVQER